MEDFANQRILVVGSDHEDVVLLVFEHHKIAGVLNDAKLFHVGFTEAEMVKYTKNNFMH